jgi:hypothetical protein
MKPRSRHHIRCHFFMAIKAERFLRPLRKTLVTITALFLQIRMALNQLSGHNQPFKNALGVRRQAQENQCN